MVYTEEYMPRTADFSRDGLLSYEAMLQIMETAGSHHSDSVSDNIIDASRRGTAWILADWRVEIFRRTESTEKLSVSTWVRAKSRAAVIYRNFELRDGAGLVLARAEAKLCVVDMSTGRLSRISDELFVAYAPEDSSVFDSDAPKLRAPSESEGEREIALRRSDIDFNGHVHNTRYLDYALEALPGEVFGSLDIKKLRIAYTKPVTESQRVTSKYALTDDGTFVSIFADDALCTLIHINS